MTVLTEKHTHLRVGESHDHYRAVNFISEAAKKKISYIHISDETAGTTLTRAEGPEELIKRWSNFYQRVREGHCAPISDGMLPLINRAPITFRQYALDNAALWDQS